MAGTTLTSWALLIWQTLRDEGIEPRPIFEAAGMDPALLGDGNARYSNAAFNKLWRKLAELEVTDIAIKIGERWNTTTFHALGFAWLASNTLKEAFERLARYGRVVDNSLKVSLVNKGSEYLLQFDVDDGVPIDAITLDAAAAALLKMTRMLVGEQFRPLAVYSRESATLCSRILEDKMGVATVYNATQEAWLVDRHTMEAPLPGGNAELARINEGVLADVLARVERDNVSGQVRQKIIVALPSGQISEQRIADELHISSRNLQRKLAEQNTSFKNLLSEVRQQLAQSYIDESHLSLSEISYLLGFSEQASFTRAFKRWQGVSPREYRRLNVGAH
ncbi:AraC-like DNA-binding protein [Alteromonadaceae bacterium 2753L.S.0a.02]|nr:AraC-like DNA-binding protein [Alteromonadaceae bacterium 2753L.S.0a.02]